MKIMILGTIVIHKKIGSVYVKQVIAGAKPMLTWGPWFKHVCWQIQIDATYLSSGFWRVGGTNTEPRGMIKFSLVKVNKKIIHTTYQNSYSAILDVFFLYKSIWIK
jgi:hypothetical protein